MQPEWKCPMANYVSTIFVYFTVAYKCKHGSLAQFWVGSGLVISLTCHKGFICFLVSCTLQLFLTDAFLWCLSSESWHAYWQPHTRTHAADTLASFTQWHCVSINIFQEVGWQTHISKQHILCSEERIVCTKVSLRSQLQLCRCRPTWPATLSLKPTKTHFTLTACPFCGLMTYFCLY